MSNDFRETMIRVHGVERVIRTERTGSVKQLEAAHTKAVKASLVELDQVVTRRRSEDELTQLRASTWEDSEGFPGSGQLSRTNAITQAETRHAERKVPKFVGAKTTYVDARKGWPKVTFTVQVPAYLREIAPGEYATEDAAQAMGAAEVFDEVLPGIALARHVDGKTWVLRHLRSITADKPDGAHLGPVFRTKSRAKQVAAEDLAGFDWTQAAEDLMADSVLANVVNLVMLREYVARKPSDRWAAENLRKAREALQVSHLESAA